MLKFKIFEIPEGDSQRTVEIGSGDIEIEEFPFKGAVIDFSFYRAPQFIRVQFELDAIVVLTCDRSLDEFNHNIVTNYEVLFKAEEVEESADENGSIRNIDIYSKQIDLEQDVLDSIMLNLPIKRLHPKYLDENGNPQEFVNEQFGSGSDEEEDNIDPRWEALKELKK